MIERRAKRLEFSDGTSVELEAGSVTVIVGPNNSGKSEAIRNLSRALEYPVEGLVIISVEFHQQGDLPDFEQWLEKNAIKTTLPNGRVNVTRVGQILDLKVALQTWESGPPFASMARFFSITAMAEARLSLVKSVSSYATRSAHPSNALQALYADPDAERRLSQAISEAFGTGIVVDRTGGSRIYLLFGDQPLAMATLPPTAQYLEEIESLKEVDEQGDGVKSFTGLTMAVGSGVYPLVFVDEPEAFLHPPQARLLGRRLAASAGDQTQVFLATHSADLLQGLIEEKPAAVNVVRVTRDGNINPTSVLTSDQLKSLWEDPLLRFSNVLDGLFHDRAVVCESDGECRFFGAAFDELQPEEGARKQEVLFTHVGGKARLHTIVTALRAVAVPTSVVADIDIIRNPDDVRRIVEALGADWADFRSAVEGVKRTVDALPAETLVEKLVADFDAIFGERDPKSKALPEDVRRARAKLKVVDGWARLKSAGVAGMPNGQPTADLNRLIESLQSIGLHVVPVGELEGFNPEIGGHGPQWVAAALEAGTHTNNLAQSFVKQVVDLG